MSMSAQTDVRVTVRVDRDLKENAEFLFERLGLNMTTAMNMFLRKAVNEDAIPFVVSTKSTGFGHGLSVDHISNAFSMAVENDVRANQQKGLPIARYDADKRQAYLEHADGTREYVNG